MEKQFCGNETFANIETTGISVDSETLLARYTHGPGIDTPISMTRGEGAIAISQVCTYKGSTADDRSH